MEKRNLAVLIVVVLAVVLVFSVYRFTGQAALGDCSDTDADAEHPDGDNKYVKGTASYENRLVEYTDYCTGGKSPRELREYYCHAGIKVKVKEYLCDDYCEEGVCVE